MKKIILFILTVLALFPASAFAQKWEIIDSLYIPREIIDGYQTREPVYYLDAKMSGRNNILLLANVGFQSPFILKSIDIGKSWHRTFQDTMDGSINTRPAARDLVYPDTSLTIFTQDSGYYRRSTDNGENWEKHRLKPNESLVDIGFWNNLNGLILVYNKTKEMTYSCQNSTDGGISWNEVSMPLKDKSSGAYLYTAGDSSAYLVEIDSKIDSAWYFYKSTNMGNTWGNRNFAYKYTKDAWSDRLFFCDENLVFHYGGKRLGQYGQTSFINRSTDGGLTWKKVLDTAAIPRNPIEDMDFCDSLNGIASAWGLIWRTSDGGLSWKADTSFDYKRFPQYAVVVKAIDKEHSLAFALPQNNYIYRYAPNNETSVEHWISVENLIAYPNPARKYIQVNISDIYDNIDYSIYDIMGIKRLEGKLVEGRIEIEQLDKGIFFLVLKSQFLISEYKGYAKFIKE